MDSNHRPGRGSFRPNDDETATDRPPAPERFQRSRVSDGYRRNHSWLERDSPELRAVWFNVGHMEVRVGLSPLTGHRPLPICFPINTQYGAGGRTRTLTIRFLRPTRMPIPPHPHDRFWRSLNCRMEDPAGWEPTHNGVADRRLHPFWLRIRWRRVQDLNLWNAKLRSSGFKPDTFVQTRSTLQESFECNRPGLSNSTLQVKTEWFGTIGLIIHKLLHQTDDPTERRGLLKRGEKRYALIRDREP